MSGRRDSGRERSRTRSVADHRGGNTKAGPSVQRAKRTSRNSSPRSHIDTAAGSPNGASHPTAPVQVGETRSARVETLGHGGEGVVRVEGFTLFVPGGLPGEHIDLEVTRLHKRHGEARLLAVRESTEDRVNPLCSVYGTCGGCQLQHASYSAQLRHKRQVVIDALMRIGGFSDVMVHETMGLSDPWHYRNKIILPVLPHSRAVDELRAGYYRMGTKELVPVSDCALAHPLLEKGVLTLARMLGTFGIRGFDARTGRGDVRALMGRVSFSTGELMLAVVTPSERLPASAEWIQALRERLPGLVSLVQNVQPRHDSETLGRENRILWGRDHIVEHMGDLTFTISPTSFFQVNPEQMKRLYALVREKAQLTGTEIVVDAHCGTGTIGLTLAEGSKAVYGFEPVAPAVLDARENAARNGIGNASFEVATAEEGLPHLYSHGITPDIVVLDPPRKGCEQELLDMLVAHRPRRIVYVSCNPATFARDLHRLCSEGGYALGDVHPVDMFPQTAHVECCVLLTRKDSL